MGGQGTPGRHGMTGTCDVGERTGGLVGVWVGEWVEQTQVAGFGEGQRGHDASAVMHACMQRLSTSASP